MEAESKADSLLKDGTETGVKAESSAKSSLVADAIIKNVVKIKLR